MDLEPVYDHKSGFFHLENLLPVINIIISGVFLGFFVLNKQSGTMASQEQAALALAQQEMDYRVDLFNKCVENKHFASLLHS